MSQKFRRFLKRLWKIVQKSEMTILPGQLAFFFVLSVIPLIALFGSLAVVMGFQIENVIDILQSIAPKAVLDLLLPVLSGKSFNINIFIFYLSALLLASNGTHSMIIASNTLYKFENKPYLNRRIKAFIMMIILVLLLLFVLVVPAFGDKIMMFIGNYIGNKNFTKNLKFFYDILKYPLSLFFIFLSVKLLYVLAPDGEVPSSSTTYGSILTTVGWLLATEVYSLYVDVFNRYNLFYGSLSNILILLLWFYILAFIFVLGMALNASTLKPIEKSE